MLYNLFCNELCQPDDPPIIVQEQKTLLASILSVLSAIFPSQTDQDYVKMGKSKCYNLHITKVKIVGKTITEFQNGVFEG